jgi:hypothetical protein
LKEVALLFSNAARLAFHRRGRMEVDDAFEQMPDGRKKRELSFRRTDETQTGVSILGRMCYTIGNVNGRRTA